MAVIKSLLRFGFAHIIEGTASVGKAIEAPTTMTCNASLTTVRASSLRPPRNPEGELVPPLPAKCMDRGDSGRVFGDMVDTYSRQLRAFSGGCGAVGGEVRHVLAT